MIEKRLALSLHSPLTASHLDLKESISHWSMMSRMKPRQMSPSASLIAGLGQSQTLTRPRIALHLYKALKCKRQLLVVFLLYY